MEARNKKHSATEVEFQTSRELMIQCWQDLGRPPVDSRLLASIQNDLAKKLSGADTESPASIARVLADSGAELRHPEVIESDARWREGHLETQTGKLADIEQFAVQSPLTLERAEEFIRTLEARRYEFEARSDDSGIDALNRFAIEARHNAQAMGTNHNLAAKVRAEQSEIAEWLKVWLQTPALFEDWLELRRRTEEFRERFAVLHHQDTKAQRK